MKTWTQDDLVKTIKELDLVPSEKLDDLVEKAESSQVDLEELLLSENIVSELDLGRLISDLYSLPFATLSEEAIKERVLKIIPEIVAKNKKIISFKEDESGLHVATTDPTNTAILENLKKKTGLPVNVYYTTASEINKALGLYAEDVEEAFEKVLDENVKTARGAKDVDPSIIKIVDVMISYSYKNRASDIHIEPYEEKSIIRFRIDGVLHDVFELPKDLHPQVITRIKVLAKLRTDEHATPQDGKIVYMEDGDDLDIRVSIVPVSGGEKAVMRLLSEHSRRFSLPDLGMVTGDLKKVSDAYKKPHGMILSTGPTGCGKTTTLYTILKILNKRDINVMTIEDPIEYDLEGVNQIQVNEKTDLTFANGLRSIVRQDPDIILVGEIRDEETADIAVNAAMTGHLVLSTLHTNDAATSIPRLLDLGIEPFLVASTVNVIIAQRLVRVICTKCRYSKDLETTEIGSLKKNISDELFIKYFKKEKMRVYSGKGCDVCHNTGYSGRVGIFEVLIVDDKVREAITSKKDASVIHKIAYDAGMTTMLEDGVKKVIEGVTTMEEVLRVTKE